MTVLARPARGLALPTVLLLVGGIAYGSLFSANKLAIDAGFPFLAYAFWQAAMAAAGLLILSALTSGLPRPNGRNLRVFMLVATAGMVVPILVFTFVADKLPPGVLTLVVAFIPTTTYLLSLMIGVDRLRWLSVSGVALGFGGILLIVLPSESLPASGMALWVVFSLLVPLSAAVNNVYGAKFSPVGTSAFSLAAGSFSVAALLLLIAMVASDGIFLPTDAEPAGLWAMLWASAAQAVTYSCFFEIVRRASGLFFAQLNYVVVAAGLFWASILFGESLSGWVWGAVVILAVSLALVNAGTARALRERDAASA